MDLLFSYTDEKLDTKRKGCRNISNCDLKLYVDKLVIIYHANFDFLYDAYGSTRNLLIEHILTVDTVTGEINTTYKLSNGDTTSSRVTKNTFRKKKNNFKEFADLIENGLLRGEKRRGYWGTKYTKATEKVRDFFVILLQPKLTTPYYQSKDYTNTYRISPIYDLVVDYHLDKNNIKGHNSVYTDIQFEYPKKKWLKKNDNKFLSAVLDSYGIKCNYLITELNKSWYRPIQIRALNYVCKLFGDNYIDYLKKFYWEGICYELPSNKKIHTLKDESEKESLIKCIEKWGKNEVMFESPVYQFNKLFTIRESLETNGIELKYRAKNDNQFINLMDSWSSHKTHISRGYKLKYLLPKEVIDILQSEIVLNDEVFKPRLLLTEEDFRSEGVDMKNCMGKQFPQGSYSIFVSLHKKRKRINVQYKNGKIYQQYGKANTVVPELFNRALLILNQRFEQHTPELTWSQEKYDIIKK
jgi:hypothetical protein